MNNRLPCCSWLMLAASLALFAVPSAAERMDATISTGDVMLHGELFKPDGPGPFPTVIWYHGASGPRPGVAEDPNSARLGPVFTRRGYILFFPHRLGYGRSPRHQLVDTYRDGNREVREKLNLDIVDLHMKEVVPAWSFLRGLPYVDPNRIAVAGCSLGGLQTVLVVQKNIGFKAAVAFAAAAQSWPNAPQVRERLISAVRNTNIPILFVQAENDYSIAASQTLSAEMKKLGKAHKLLIYPAFGSTAADGHAFCTRGGDIWTSEVFSFLDQTMK